MAASIPLWPHKEDNEIQLLSVTAEGHEELYRPGASTLILPECHEDRDDASVYMNLQSEEGRAAL